jgi:prevent-host-death family protein
MDKIGIFEAKTKLSEICTKVEESGTEYVITRHGRPVARIVGMPKSSEDPLGLLERMAQVESELGPLSDETVEFPDVWLERKGRKPDPLDDDH